MSIILWVSSIGLQLVIAAFIVQDMVRDFPSLNYALAQYVPTFVWGTWFVAVSLCIAGWAIYL